MTERIESMTLYGSQATRKKPVARLPDYNVFVKRRRRSSMVCFGEKMLFSARGKKLKTLT